MTLSIIKPTTRIDALVVPGIRYAPTELHRPRERRPCESSRLQR